MTDSGSRRGISKTLTSQVPVSTFGDEQNSAALTRPGLRWLITVFCFFETTCAIFQACNCTVLNGCSIFKGNSSVYLLLGLSPKLRLHCSVA